MCLLLFFLFFFRNVFALCSRMHFLRQKKKVDCLSFCKDFSKLSKTRWLRRKHVITQQTWMKRRNPWSRKLIKNHCLFWILAGSHWIWVFFFKCVLVKQRAQDKRQKLKIYGSQGLVDTLKQRLKVLSS